MIKSIQTRLTALAAGVFTSLCAFAELPDAFVEYVGTETTYVKTGLCPSPKNTRMLVDLSFTTINSTQQALFGSGNSWGNANSAYVLLNNGSFRVDYIGSQTAAMTPVLGQHYVLDCCNNVVTINGTRYASSSTKNTDTLKEMYFFNENNNGSLVKQGKMRIYSAAIWLDGSTLDALYVPCVKDDVAGLYNIVDGTIIYGEVAANLTASETANADYRVNDGTVETKLSVVQNGTGGTTAMAAANWAAPGASVTLTATPDAGMIAVWLITDNFGNLTTLKGSSVNYTMPVCPASASLSFAPEGALTSADDIYAAIAAAAAGSTVNLCAGPSL